MPEIYELWAILLIIFRWFNSVKDDSTVSKTLQDIWVDPTKKEQLNSKKSSLPGQGHVYPLKNTSNIKRGSQRSKSPVWPPQISTSIRDAKVELRAIHPNPRNVILEFKGVESGEQLWFQLQTLTHTVVQVYTRKQWDDSISKVNRQERGFKIGVALDFGEYVMAFLTLDLLFQPIWSSSREQLPAQHIDVCEDFSGFVKSATQWAQRRLSTQRNDFATAAIRKACEVFGGVGVYTVQELFFRAGLSPFLTEAEVFDNPSRFARLCEAYYSHAIRARESMWEFIFPHLHDRYILAVKNEERLRYASWLFVYMKDRTAIPARMKDLLTAYNDRICELTESGEDWIRDGSQGLYDVFEPTYLKASLMKEENLGHLIWGCDGWLAMGGKRWLNCPLDSYFSQRGFDFTTQCFPTFLRPLALPLPPDFWEATLFVDDTTLKKAWVPTKLYRSHDKPIWTLLPPFPCNSSDPINAGESSKLEVIQVIGDARARELFQYIVTYTNDYAVGPLDYCGVARILHGQVAICRNDPASRPYHVVRLEQNFSRRSEVKPGSRKAASKKTPRRRTNITDVKSGEKNADSPPPQKRQRLSADKKLLLGIS